MWSDTERKVSYWQGAWEEAEVDAIVDYTEGNIADLISGIVSQWWWGFSRYPDDGRFLTDIFKGFVKYFYAVLANDPKADEIKKQFLTTDIVPYLQKYKAILAQTKSGYLVGQGPTWADFCAVAFLDQLVELDKSILASHPELKDYVNRIHNTKGIKEWLAKRPQTTF